VSQRIVAVIGVLVLALVLAACGSDSAEPPPSTALDAGVPSCDEWWQRAVTAEEVRDGCVDWSDDPVSSELAGTAVYDCDDGRTLYWNDLGWGYVGEPMNTYADGAELVAPEADRSACPV